MAGENPVSWLAQFIFINLYEKYEINELVLITKGLMILECIISVKVG